jgi:hypothetical protein
LIALTFGVDVKATVDQLLVAVKAHYKREAGEL